MFEDSPEKPAQDKDPIEVFSEVLAAYDPVLRKIEKNTSVLPTLLKSITVTRGTRGAHFYVRDLPKPGAPLQQVIRQPKTSTPKEGTPTAAPERATRVRTVTPKQEPAAAATPAPAQPPQTASPIPTPAPEVVAASTPNTEPAAPEQPKRPRTPPRARREGTPAQTTATAAEPVRDRRGRFQSQQAQEGRSVGQRAHEQQQQEQQENKRTSFFKKALDFVVGKGKDKGEDIEDAVGKSIGGPIWEAAKEMQGAAGDLKEKLQDKNTVLGKSAQWLGKKTGLLKTKGPEAPPTEGAEQRRHRELIQTIEGHSDGGGGGGGSAIAEAIGGGAAGGIGGKLLSKIPGAGIAAKVLSKAGPILGVLTSGTVLAGVAAAGAVLAAGKSAIFGGSNPINDLYEKLGGPKVSTDPDKADMNRRTLANTERVNAERVKQGKQPLKYDPVTGDVLPGVTNAVPGSTTTVDSNGQLVTRTGDRNWRNNNPGNLEYGPFAKSMGAIGSDGRFAVFPDYKAGRTAMGEKLFKSKDYSGLNLSDAIAKWAPPGENDTSGYQNAVLKVVGGKNKRMSQYTPAEQQAIMDAMQKKEGYRAGTVEAAGAVPSKKAASTPAQGNVPDITQPTAMQDLAPAPLTAQLMGTEQLVAALNNQNKQKQTAAAPSPIKKHYDDTLLTLMAHDRI